MSGRGVCPLSIGRILAIVTEPMVRSARLGLGFRIATCLGAAWWLVLALKALSACYGMATFKAGPGDRAAHGMVPADLQINVIGVLLSAVSGMMAVSCLALM